MGSDTKTKFDKVKNITYSKYFSYDLSFESKSPILRFINLFGRVINKILRLLAKVELRRINSSVKIEQIYYSMNNKVKELQIEGIVSKISTFYSQLEISINKDVIHDTILEYDRLFRNSTISNLHGGMGYNNGLVCFCFIKSFSPEIVVESGIFRGFTTYLIDNAISDKSLIKAFDISLLNIEWRSRKAEYFESDINDIELNFFNKKTLALFDDHVSHYDRLKYCLDNEIQYVILDDDVSIEIVHSDGWPPIPTANMVFNYENIPHKFEWNSNGKVGRADISNLDCDSIIQKYKYIKMPELFKYTGYMNSSVTSFIVRR